LNDADRDHSGFAWKVTAFLAGQIGAAEFSRLPPVWAIAVIAGLAIVLALRRVRLLSWFLFGIAWPLALATWRLGDELPHAWQQQDIRIEGTVIGIPDRSDDGVRFDFATGRVISPVSARVPHKIRLNWYRASPEVKAGEHWVLTVRLKRPHGYANPGGLDYEQWLFLQGIRATGYVREDAANARTDPPPSPWNVQVWRQRVFDVLYQSLSWTDQRGILIALTMGEESAISGSQWTVLRRTGTAHLVAVSGSHIGLIAGLVFLITRRIWARLFIQRWSPPDVAAAASSLAALLYSALAGFSLPTQRALIMIAVVMAAIIAKRNLRPFRTLWTAALTVCLWDPYAVLAPGFWLSFGAVALILLDLGYRLRPPSWWTGMARINWITAVGLASCLLLFFQQVSLVSPIANLIAVPTLGLIGIPLALTSTLLFKLVPPLGAAALTMTEQWLQNVWLLLTWLAQLPAAQWTHAAPAAWTLLLAVPGSLLLLAPRGIPARWLGLILWLPALSIRPEPPEPGSVRLTLLDVGQGLATVVQTHSKVLVFDTGARFSERFDMATAVIEPFLLAQGIDTIDRLVVSHGDNDHIGGAPTLINHFSPDSIYTSVPDVLAGSTSCIAGQTWQWDGANFEMLSPTAKAANDNDNSCVLKISTGKGCALLTGDIERPAELQLVDQYGTKLNCELLIVPHHGSNTSSSQEFLNNVAPRYALFPYGYLNRYGFPHPKVVARFKDLKVMMLDSASAGAITVDIGPQGIAEPPREFRKQTGRYWTDQVSTVEAEANP
jgi:competence protein ComEC